MKREREKERTMYMHQISKALHLIGLHLIAKLWVLLCRTTAMRQRKKLNLRGQAIYKIIASDRA